MKHIVVVNNDKDFLESVKILLEDHAGFKATILHEGKTAYRKIVKLQPDLIILDIRMESPITGWKILDLLTLHMQTKDIPVIICSASVKDVEEKEEWLKGHGIYFLPKPFDIEDLLAMVSKAMRVTKRRKGQTAEFLKAKD